MSMKKILNTIAALTLVMFVGCVQETIDEPSNPEETPVETPDENPAEKTTVTIEMPSDEDDEASVASLKTSLGELVDGKRKVYWCEGDKVNINGLASTSTTLSEDKRTATFDFDAVLNYPYSVLYPAEMYKDAQTITLPAVQASAENTFTDGASPMAAYQSEKGEIVMHHLAGVVHLQVKLPEGSKHGIHALNRVEFRGNAGEQVAGDFTIDYEAATLASASTQEADQKVVAMVEKTLSSEASTEVFVVVPAIQYAQGFTIRLVDAAGHYMDISSGDTTILAGDVKVMPAVSFVPHGTLTEVEISTAANLVEFARTYNAGEFSENEDLKVKLVSDIVFDDETNAAWESIGTADIYFKGTFDGKGYSIKNWISTKPLFYATYVNGYIENLTLDASCQVNIDVTNTSNNVGSFVAYHRGTLKNCHNNATLNITGESSSDLFAGGLVGRMRVESKVEDCSMTGDVIADANLSVAGLIDLGGLVGYTQEAEASILNSDFSGNLTFSGAISTDDYAYIGGIIGRSKATVKDCSTSADKTITAESTENKVARILLGGIAGSAEANSLEDCTNNSPLKVKYLRAKGTGYLYLGGVIGYLSAAASVKGCHNTNNVHSYCDANNAYIGGIVGNARANSIIDDCHNESTAEISVKNLESGSYGSRYLELGGVIGRCETSIVSNISNAGKVDMNRAENSNNALVYVGGCLGNLTAVLDGQNTITNSGEVTATDGCPNRNSLALGGVVGCINAEGATLSNVSNTGNVTDAVTVAHKNTFSGGVVGLIRTSATVQNVTNSGTVYFSNNQALVHVNTALGGIVGGTLADKVCVVKNSVNDGKVSTVSISKIAGSGMVCGGVVGILRGAGSSVQECTNNGIVQIAGINNSYYDGSNDPSNSKSAWTAGGIVGFGAGTSDSRISIVDCINKAECYGARGYVGGVSGYVRYANIERSHHQSASKVRGANSSVRVGGITGYLESSTIAECSVTGTVDGVSNAFTGGVSAGMNATSVISSSIVNAKVTNSGSNGTVGAIVSYSETGSVIRDCAASGQIGIGSELVNITTSDFDPSGKATIEFSTKKLRVGVIGDSISTFSGVIPSAYKAYYPKGDVDLWTETYWARLINEYWNAELDLNCSYSGSRVAPISGYDSDFVARCETFINPDVVLLHGGTNDCASEYVELGEYDFTSSVDNLNTFARFRESYIAVIKKMQTKYPDALIICIVGDYAKGDYGESVKTIAEHFDLPYVDFRGDSKVTKCSGSHPNAAGMAHMAARIYEETKEQVEEIKSKLEIIGTINYLLIN